MYERLAHFAQTWGMFYVLILFAGVLAYALWPRNKAKFDHAARMPLEDDDRPAPPPRANGADDGNAHHDDPHHDDPHHDDSGSR